MMKSYIIKELQEKCLPKLVESLKKTSLLGEDENRANYSLIVEGKDNNCHQQPKRLPSISKKGTEEDPMNLTGNPLQCSFTLDATDDEDDDLLATPVIPNEGYSPIDIDTARSLINQKASEKGEIWAYCDGSDPKSTIYIGSKRGVESGNNTVTFNQLTYEGAMDMNEDSGLFMRLEERHKTLIANDSEIQVTSTVSCLYDLISNEGDSNSLQVSIDWSNPRGLLEKPSAAFHSSPLKIKAIIRLGDEKIAACHGEFIELSILSGLAKGLFEEEVVWQPLNNGTTMEDDLLAVFQAAKSKGPRTPFENLERFQTVQRPEMDFTDLLWKCFSKAQSYRDLCSGFKNVIQVLDREDLRPYMFKSNSTKAKALIMNVVKDGISGVNFEDLQPGSSSVLKMLVEMGIQKLFRDHMFAFQNICLSLPNVVKDFSIGNDIQAAIRRLYKVQHLRELAFLFQTYISPDKEVLSEILHQAETKLNEIPDNKDKIAFNFSLDNESIKERLSRVMPTIWQLRLSSQNSNVKALSTYRFCVDPPAGVNMESGGYHKSEEHSHDEDISEPIYYFTSLLTISRVI